jgi:hypothetical protein
MTDADFFVIPRKKNDMLSRQRSSSQRMDADLPTDPGSDTRSPVNRQLVDRSSAALSGGFSEDHRGSRRRIPLTPVMGFNNLNVV